MNIVQRASHFVHAWFIWLLLGSYVVAAILPGPGLWLRTLSIGSLGLPVLMLGFLLFNAGLGIDLSALDTRRENWVLLGWGLAANALIPIIYIGLVTIGTQFWPDAEEVQNILVGLALVASMPIAGSSTAWSQNANGNLALSLGLVLGSTLLSPLATPVALHSVGLMTTGDYSEDLHELAGAQSGWFLLTSVIVPSLLGIGVRRLVGKHRVTATRPHMKLANSAVLLLLNYSNASASLPQAVATPDYDFLMLVLAMTGLMCVVGFFAGWLISYLRRASQADQVALMFGLGRNNNGTGLVLASLALADHPQVLLPIIFYNLVQHLVAGIVDYRFFRRGDAGEYAAQ